MEAVPQMTDVSREALDHIIRAVRYFLKYPDETSYLDMLDYLKLEKEIIPYWVFNRLNKYITKNVCPAYEYYLKKGCIPEKTSEKFENYITKRIWPLIKE